MKKKRSQELQELVHKLLTLSLDKGDVYIITNADKGWVEYSSKLIYPSISDILQKIRLFFITNYKQTIIDSCKQFLYNMT